MAVVDERWSGAPVRPAGPAPFDRQPPQDMDAEQSVLGGMLLSKDAIADVVESVRSADFYKPAHSLVFDAVVDLYSRGEPADTDHGGGGAGAGRVAGPGRRQRCICTP